MEVVDNMVMSDVKEEEVVNRIIKMATELHFSGDRKVCQDRPKLFQCCMSSMHLLFVILITQMKT